MQMLDESTDMKITLKNKDNMHEYERTRQNT